MGECASVNFDGYHIFASERKLTMSNYKFETLQLHVGQETADPATDSQSVPIYATSSYVFHDCAHAAARFGLTDAGNIYGRLTNSTQEVFEKRIAALEGGVAALAVSSGAAAISYVLQALGQNGGHFLRRCPLGCHRAGKAGRKRRQDHCGSASGYRRPVSFHTPLCRLKTCSICDIISKRRRGPL